MRGARRDGVRQMKNFLIILTAIAVSLSACQKDPSDTSAVDGELEQIGSDIQMGTPKSTIRAQKGAPQYEASDGMYSCVLYPAGESKGWALLEAIYYENDRVVAAEGQVDMGVPVCDPRHLD